MINYTAERKTRRIFSVADEHNINNINLTNFVHFKSNLQIILRDYSSAALKTISFSELGRVTSPNLHKQDSLLLLQSIMILTALLCSL